MSERVHQYAKRNMRGPARIGRNMCDAYVGEVDGRRGSGKVRGGTHKHCVSQSGGVRCCVGWGGCDGCIKSTGQDA